MKTLVGLLKKKGYTVQYDDNILICNTEGKHQSVRTLQVEKMRGFYIAKVYKVDNTIDEFRASDQRAILRRAILNPCELILYNR